jgi:hypothetical protein
MASEDLCGVDWGVCPDCGPTLRGEGGETRCMKCGTRWGHGRLWSPCDEPAAATVRDQGGAEVRMCRQHALAAGRRLAGAQLSWDGAGPVRHESPARPLVADRLCRRTGESDEAWQARVVAFLES